MQQKERVEIAPAYSSVFPSPENLARFPLPEFKEYEWPGLKALCITDTHEQAGLLTASLIASAHMENPDGAVVGATGRTQAPVREALIQLVRMDLYDPTHGLHTHLDNRCGVDCNNPLSYTHEMTQLWDSMGIPTEHRYSPDGSTPEIKTMLQEWKKMLDENPRSVTWIGIGGSDPHIAFVMPNDPRWKKIHQVKLSKETIAREIARGDVDESGKPLEYAITMGIEDILDTKLLVMIAAGNTSYAHSVFRMLTEDPNINAPATFVRTHPNAIVVLDALAASKILPLLPEPLKHPTIVSKRDNYGSSSSVWKSDNLFEMK
jgi:glucosamine-6-phosphate deaminase